MSQAVLLIIGLTEEVIERIIESRGRNRWLDWFAWLFVSLNQAPLLA